ncbi:hypothetical protein TWF481_003954 [Arthrobotrys musiformis]|uniref:Uncharacterized protein n=1 Tax=Arthrobotrys musiformis TaxID=47236 RepID=A0AAV9WI65_9PEZI
MSTTFTEAIEETAALQSYRHEPTAQLTKHSPSSSNHEDESPSSEDDPSEEPPLDDNPPALIDPTLPHPTPSFPGKEKKFWGGFGAFKYQSNRIKIINKTPNLTLTGGKFTISQFCISEGQDPSNINKIGNVLPLDDKHRITFKVGRHGTEEVAEWWKKFVPPAKNTFVSKPHKLNFAFLGTLRLDFEGKGGGEGGSFNFFDVALGFGDYAGLINHWWFGGSICTAIGDNEVSCNGMSAEGGVAGLEANFRRGGFGNSADEVEITQGTFR